MARLESIKDIPTMLEAIKLASNDIPDLRLQIVGDGSEMARLQDITRQSGLLDRVQFLGKRSDVPDLLQQAGFYLASSVSEGMSLAVLEAMGAGLPVITTDVGGNPEIVDSSYGYLVPAGNPRAMADAIRTLCKCQNEWGSLGQMARKRVLEHFNAARMLRDYEQVYDECLKAKS